MGKISTYATTTPTTTDLLIGTDVGSSDATKNFTVSSILDLQDNLTVKEEGVNVATDCTSIDVVGDGATASAVGSAVTITIPGTLTLSTNAGADFTLALSDAHKYIRCTGTASTITVPTNAAVAFPIGTEIVLRPANAQATLRALASGGVTINYYSPAAGASAKVNLQDNLFLKKVATDEWDAWGNLI